MFDRSCEIGFLGSSGDISSRPKRNNILQLRVMKPVAMTGSLTITANELSFFLDKIALFVSKSSVTRSDDMNPPIGGNREHGSYSYEGASDVVDFPVQACVENLHAVATLRKKLGSIPNYVVDNPMLEVEDSPQERAPVSIVESVEAVEYKRQLVYVISNYASCISDETALQNSSSEVARGESESSKSRVAFDQKYLFDTTKREKNQIIEGYGFDCVKAELPTVRRSTKSEVHKILNAPLAGVNAEALSSISWIISACRGALAHVYSDEVEGAAGGNAIDRIIGTTTQNNILTWKEIVDLNHSISERKRLIQDILADLRELDDYIKLSKLYGSEISLLLESTTLSGSRATMDESQSSAIRKMSTNTLFDEHYAPLIERCAMLQLEYELRLPSNSLLAKYFDNECDSVHDIDRKGHRIDSSYTVISPVANPLKILMQSVFPVTELRPTVADRYSTVARPSEPRIPNNGDIQ